MKKLDRKKLETVLVSRGMNLSLLARESGISRQSLYNMFEGRNIFSVPFQKLVMRLGVDALAFLSEGPCDVAALSDAPEAVRKASFELQAFAEERKADLFLVGSRARGKRGIRHDWDFAILFPGAVPRAEFAREKQRLSDTAFPQRVDVVCLNDAPPWFLSSVAREAIRLTGTTPDELVFSARGRDHPRRIA